MRNIDVVMQRIYESKDFAVKGYSAYLKDAFFLKKFNNPYIVFLTQIGELSGEILLHKYTFYSVNDKKEVDESTALYKNSVSLMYRRTNPAISRA